MLPRSFDGALDDRDIDRYGSFNLLLEPIQESISEHRGC